jgi:NAD(P)-dependent dehydrogenase (short-subunit alcohol dehydrogenase family)
MNAQSAVVITGSNSGIGRATGQEFMNAGYKVFGLDISKSSPPHGVIFIQADVSSETEVAEAFKEISRRTNHLDGLVNNAAICSQARLVDMTAEEWDAVISVNLKGAFLMTKAAYPLLKKSASPAIVNVGSVHAIGTSRGVAAYAASKGGLVALTRAAALELAEDMIRVNCVLPGAVDTPMLEDGLKRAFPESDSIPASAAALASRTPLGRIGVPTEIARAILFLASTETASFITGQTLAVDGGALARLSTE